MKRDTVCDSAFHTKPVSGFCAKAFFYSLLLQTGWAAPLKGVSTGKKSVPDETGGAIRIQARTPGKVLWQNLPDGKPAHLAPCQRTLLPLPTFGLG